MERWSKRDEAKERNKHKEGVNEREQTKRKMKGEKRTTSPKREAPEANIKNVHHIWIKTYRSKQDIQI